MNRTFGERNPPPPRRAHGQAAMASYSKAARADGWRVTAAVCRLGAFSPRPSAYLVYTLVAGVLLISAALKLWQLLAGTWMSAFGSSWLAVLLVQYEAFLGAWLLTGAFPRMLRRVSSLTFLAFAGVSVLKIAAGAESCGCFGALEFSPWWSLLIDTTVLALLAVQIQPPGSVRRAWSDLTFPVVLSLVVGVIGAWLFPGDSFDVLQPESWVGQELPLLEDIDIADSLHTGRWTVVLVHYDCARCKETIAEFSSTQGRRLAIVQIPPYGEMQAGTRAVVGFLRDDREWLVETPTVLTLEDGQVLSVSH